MTSGIEDLIGLSLSREQEVVALCGVVVIFIFLFGIGRTATGYTPRRVLSVIVAALIFILGGWMLGDATFTLSRDNTLVASCHTSPDEFLATANNVLPATSSFDVVVFAENDLSLRACVDALEDTLTPLGKRFTGIAGIKTPSGLEPFLTKRSNRGVSWLTRLKRVARQMRTIVIIHDPNDPAWDKSIAATAVAAREAVDEFKGEIFVTNPSGAAAAYGLDVRLAPTVRPNQELGVSRAFLDFEVYGGDHTDEELLIDLCVSLNRTTSLTDCEESFEEDRYFQNQVALKRETTGLPQWSWSAASVGQPRRRSFNEFFNISGPPGIRTKNETLYKTQLSTGWHFLEFRARVISPGPDYGLELTPRIVHFRAESQGPAIVFGEQSLLAEAWPAPLKTGVPALLKETWDKEWSGRFVGRPDFECREEESSVTDAALRACLERAGSLILLEPSSHFLSKLTTWGVPEMLQSRGAPILVVAPKVTTADRAALEAWLPALPSASDPVGTQSIVHSVRDIVLIADCSGLAHIPFADDFEQMMDEFAPRPIDLQREIVAALNDQVRSIPNRKATLLYRSPTKDQLLALETTRTWEPAIHFQIVAGCLRASSSEQQMNDTADLAEFADIEDRIGAFLGEDSHASVGPFAAFQSGHQHSGSVIIIMSTQAAQAGHSAVSAEREGGAFDLPASLAAYQPSPGRLAALRDADVRIIVIELPTNRRFADAVDNAVAGAGGTTWESSINDLKASDMVEHIEMSAADTPESVASNILLLSDIQMTGPYGTELINRSRVLDPRIRKQIPAAPNAIIELTPLGSAEVLVRGAAGTAFAGKPLVVANETGVAPIVVLAYNPFGPTVWASDRLAPTRLSDSFLDACEPGCRISSWINDVTDDLEFPRILDTNGSTPPSSGLGVQRLIDIVELSTRPVPESNGLLLTGIEVLPYSEGVDFSFAVPAGATEWPAPLVGGAELPGDHCSVAIGLDCPLQLLSIDTLTNQLVYRFRTLSDNGLTDPLVSHKATMVDISITSAAGQKDIAKLPLRLMPQSQISPSSSRFVGAMRAVGVTSLSGELPIARRSVAEIVFVLLLLKTLLMFSKIMRPWHAFDRFRKRRSRSLLPIGFDADLARERAGQILAKIEASRRAGDPAWTRGLEPGDSLTRVMTSDLVGWTQLGQSLGIPQRKPRVRLREVGESFDIVIGIDDSAAMRYPGSSNGMSRKRFVVEALVAVVTEAVMRKSGRWTLVGLRSGVTLDKISSRDPAAISDALDIFFRNTNDTSVLTTADLSRTAPRLVISDFLDLSIPDYVEWIGGSEGGAILIRDDKQTEELGIGRTATTAAIVDRSFWESNDIAVLLAQHWAEVRDLVQQSGCAFADISVDASDEEVATMLADSGVLTIARR